MNEDLDSPSYLEMKMHLDGEKAKVLRVPTFWNAVDNEWIAAIKTPVTRKLITARAHDSLTLQNKFNVALSNALHDPLLSEEVFGMFKE